MVRKIDSEVAKRLGSPSFCRGQEAEASWIYHRYDGHRNSAIWKVYTADATIKLNKNAKEIFVGDALGVDCSLDTSYQE